MMDTLLWAIMGSAGVAGIRASARSLRVLGWTRLNYALSFGVLCSWYEAEFVHRLHPHAPSVLRSMIGYLFLNALLSGIYLEHKRREALSVQDTTRCAQRANRGLLICFAGGVFLLTGTALSIGPETISSEPDQPLRMIVKPGIRQEFLPLFEKVEGIIRQKQFLIALSDKEKGAIQTAWIESRGNPEGMFGKRGNERRRYLINFTPLPDNITHIVMVLEAQEKPPGEALWRIKTTVDLPWEHLFREISHEIDTVLDSRTEKRS